jgi:hypothetical protein
MGNYLLSLLEKKSNKESEQCELDGGDRENLYKYDNDNDDDDDDDDRQNYVVKKMMLTTKVIEDL